MALGSDSPFAGKQATHNVAVWSDGDYVGDYDRTDLTGSESVLLARYHEACGGRVLDVGCGAGRLLRYLRLLGSEVHGVDVSERMVAHCRRRFPDLDVHIGDLRDLGATETGPYDAVIIADNTLDVFDDGERRAVLSSIPALLSPRGLLVFTSHNLDCWDQAGGELQPSRLWRLASYLRDILRGKGGSALRAALGPARTWANRRRLAPLQYRAADHAVFNDLAHEGSLLHYYIGAPAARRQLAELGYDVLDVLELDGDPVPPGAPGRSFWLTYVASPHTG